MTARSCMNESGGQVPGIDFAGRRPVWPAVLMGALLASGMALGTGCSRMPQAAGPPVEAEHIRVRLVAETPELVPGATTLVAVLIELDSEWHVYAPARNDTGLPVLLRFSGPSGYEFAPPLWPAPERAVSSGSILDHVYGDGTAIAVPVTVPADAAAGERVTLTARVEWLVCGESCILGEADLEITLPVGQPGAARPASAQAALIRRSLGRVPVPLRLAPAGVEFEREPGAWSIQVPGASALTFYPGEECVPLADPIADAASRGDRLRLRLEESAGSSDRLVGILEIEKPERTLYRAIDAPAATGRAAS